jgi:hypothetical protein
MIDDTALKRIFCKSCAAEPSAVGWPELAKFGQAVAAAALEDAATLIELEYAPDKKAHDRLKQIARHVRNMAAQNDSGCPSGKCTSPAHECIWYWGVDA